MALLKLIALEPSDVRVVSAHLQDAVLPAADMSFDARCGRFALICNRFDWQSEGTEPAQRQRHRAALRIDRVSHVQSRLLDLADRSHVLSILAVVFNPDPDPGQAPGGAIEIVCAGGVTLRLTVECVEMALEDLGPVWQAQSVPEHAADGGA